MRKIKFAIVFFLANFIAVGYMNAQTLKNEPARAKAEVKSTEMKTTEVKTSEVAKTNHPVATNGKHVPVKEKSELAAPIRSDQAGGGRGEVDSRSKSGELKMAPLSPK
jgi:hypothetical protein